MNDIRDFRKKSLLEQKGHASANQFDAYVDQLVQNGAQSNTSTGARSVREAQCELIEKQRTAIKNARGEQKANLKKLKRIEQEIRREERGKGCLDIRDLDRRRSECINEGMHRYW